jgi:signal transduction histidine kinase
MDCAGDLFKGFGRWHRPYAFTGSGVGLAIARRVIKRHGGKVCGESKAGKSATASFRLCPPVMA